VDLNLKKIRDDFPSLAKKNKGKDPLYFDSACMSLRPKSVILAMNEYYEVHPSCHNRTIHAYGEMTTEKYEKARRSIATFLNSPSEKNIIFTKNTTESINMVAKGIGLEKGDCILTSNIEHNSNFLPWQFSSHNEYTKHLCFSVDQKGNFSFEEYENFLKENPVKLVSVFMTSHILGTTLPIKKMVEIAHRYNALFLLDAAQSVAHEKIDVMSMDVDFMAFSFHKAYGPTGVGCLYGKTDLLEKMTPLYYGGETVVDVNMDTCVVAPLPQRLEAGLQNYAGVLGAAEALNYLKNIGLEKIKNHESSLKLYLYEKMQKIARVHILGDHTGTLLNFYVEGIDSGELSIMLSKTRNIMLRSGVHCAHSWYHEEELPATLRVSLGVYNTKEEVDTFLETLENFIRFY
jgi:cysteine desulfurase/selenocysteine lyase